MFERLGTDTTPDPPETRATAQPILLPTPPKRMQPCNRLDSRLPRSCRAPLMVKGQREGSHLTVARSRGKIHYEDDRRDMVDHATGTGDLGWPAI